MTDNQAVVAIKKTLWGRQIVTNRLGGPRPRGLELGETDREALIELLTLARRGYRGGNRDLLDGSRREAGNRVKS